MRHNSIPRFRARYPASSLGAAAIRGEVKAVARELGIEGEELGEVALAVSGAVTNAAFNGSAQRDDPHIGVRVDVDDLEILVTISGGTEVCLTFPRATSAQVREATNHVHDDAVRRLDEALAEEDRLGRSFEAAVGTTTEFGAYVRLQHASEQVAARQTWLTWVESES